MPLAIDYISTGARHFITPPRAPPIRTEYRRRYVYVYGSVSCAVVVYTRASEGIPLAKSLRAAGELHFVVRRRAIDF